MEIREGEKIAVIGDNGSVKSTLLKCISGILSQDNTMEAGKENIAYLPADLCLFLSQTVYKNICMGGNLSQKDAVKLLYNFENFRCFQYD